MAGTLGATAEVAMDLDKVKQDIEDVRGALKSCEDAQERRELRKLMTVLLEEKARLAGTAAGGSGPPSQPPAGGSSDLQEIKAMLQHQAAKLDSMQFVAAYQLNRLSPWATPSSHKSTLSNKMFKNSLVKLYHLEVRRDEWKNQYVQCQVTREVLRSEVAVAAHLLPRKVLPEDAANWGILDPASDVRNGLVWFAGIEQAWTRKQVCLQYDATGVLRLRVLSTEIWKKTPVELLGNDIAKTQYATEALRTMTFSDLDGQPLFFPEGVQERPYQRVVVAEAAEAITTQWKLGLLRPEVEQFNLEVLSDFPQKKHVSSWVETTMVHLPDWPTGPDAEAQRQQEAVE